MFHSFFNCNEIDCIFSNKHAYDLLKETPFFSNCILSNQTKVERLSSGEIDLDLMERKIKHLSSVFDNYDYLIINRPGSLRKTIEKFISRKQIKKLIQPKYIYNKFVYRPHAVCMEYGFPCVEINLKINWYKKNFYNFKCNKKTVLLNGESAYLDRTYLKISSVAEELSDLGFDVRYFDFSENICKNMHLIDQAAFVLTTETSTIWLAKALGKNPYVFLSSSNQPINQLEKILNSKNIIENFDNLNDVSPQNIVFNFAYRCIKFN
jgi:hypothetical protein